MIDLATLTLGRQLGAGGQGKVFFATDPMGEAFAVKLLELRPDANRALILERASVFRLDPLESALSSILSFGLISNAPVELRRQLGKTSKEALLVVTRFIQGDTLARSTTRKCFTLLEVAATLSGAARSTARLPAGAAHGDVRAPNIFIRPSGEMVLADPDLMREPDAAEDLHGLTALGRTLIAEVPRAADEDLARDKLTALLEGLDGPEPISPRDATQWFAEIAISLGAPAGDVTAVLAARGAGEVAEHGPVSTPLPPSRRNRFPMVLAIDAALVLVAIAAYQVTSRRAAPGTGGTSADSLYDTTGTVHYTEPIHPLAPKELVAANDGVVHLSFESSIPRIAILSPRKEILWELRTPPAGTSVLLDAKPGHYYVEQDRDLGSA